MNARRTSTEARASIELQRAAIYTRKSTGKGLERDFNSLDAQREACEQYIQSRAYQGWQLVETRYDDGGFTGANIDRPAFARLLDDVDAGRIDVVVVHKVDRLSRSLLDFAGVMGRFSEAGTAFVSVTQNFSTADAMGRLTLNVLMSFAEFEREMISERTRDKIAGARRRGKWTGGSVPFGYAVDDKKLVILAEEAPIVREIFGRYVQDHSALEVAQHLNEVYPNTEPRTYRGKRRQPGRAWTKHAVLRVLKNPLYAGLIPLGDEVFDGEHEAIVERETFRLAAARLDAHSRYKPGRPPNADYLLTGRIFCALCGSALTPKSTTKRRTGKTYRYYSCVAKDQKGRKACKARPLTASALEEFAIARIREATADGALARDIATRIDAYAERKRGVLLAERRKLPGEIAALAAEARRLLDTLTSVEPAAQRLVEARLEEVGLAVAGAEARLAEVERALLGLDARQTEGRWVQRTLENFGVVWDVMTPRNRLRLVRGIVRRVEVDEPRGAIHVLLHDLAVEPPEGDDGADCSKERTAQGGALKEMNA